jgi:hypothetical protein
MILEKCELWYPCLDPKRPNKKFDKENPSWEVQIRTTDKKQRKEWEEANLNVHTIVPEDDDVNDGKPFFLVYLKKRITRKDGLPALPVEVLDAKLEPVDPNSIGNGSIADVRLYQYSYPTPAGGTKTSSILLGLQLLKHKLYVPVKRQEFTKRAEDTEVCQDFPAGTEDDLDPDTAPTEGFKKKDVPF